LYKYAEKPGQHQAYPDAPLGADFQRKFPGWLALPAPYRQNTFEILVLPEGHAETSLGLFLAPYAMLLRSFSQEKMLTLPRKSERKTLFTPILMPFIRG
jgi:hypothetical protein